jgi:hypothetical protein
MENRRRRDSSYPEIAVRLTRWGDFYAVSSRLEDSSLNSLWKLVNLLSSFSLGFCFSSSLKSVVIARRCFTSSPRVSYENNTLAAVGVFIFINIIIFYLRKEELTRDQI